MYTCVGCIDASVQHRCVTEKRNRILVYTYRVGVHCTVFFDMRALTGKYVGKYIYIRRYAGYVYGDVGTYPIQLRT